MGTTYLYVRSGTTWSKLQKLVAGDAAIQDFFGFAAAIDHATVLIGAYAKNGSQGAAYAFVHAGAVWVQQQQLLAGDGGPGAMFGYSVALAGDSALVGAPGQHVAVGGVAGIKSGAAYEFSRSGLLWSQQLELAPADGAPGDQFGYAVALSGAAAGVGSLMN